MPDLIELRPRRKPVHLPEPSHLGGVAALAPPSRPGWVRFRLPELLAAAVIGLLASTDAGAMPLLFAAQFGGPARLVTNEYATHHPHAAGIAHSSQWIVTSGSLFAARGIATNGRLDRTSPDARSSNGTDSAVFRAYTRQLFRPDYSVTFDLRVRSPDRVHGARTAAWNGVHVMVDAESPEAAYYVSLYRRDGRSVIKKKTSPGPVAGGAYDPLSKYVPSRVRAGRWTPIRIDVRRSTTRSLTIDLYEAGALVVTATDDRTVTRSAPYLRGRLGIRADSTEFAMKDFSVHRVS